MTVSGLCPFLLGLTSPILETAPFPGHVALITRESCDCIIDNTQRQGKFFPATGMRLLLDAFQQCETGCYSLQ